MTDEYSLKFFREHYLEHRGVQPQDKEAIVEAFMGGAHTVMLMVTNAIQNDDKALMRRITQELSEFITVKRAEAEFEKATVH